jgi:hypothetical protein
VQLRRTRPASLGVPGIQQRLDYFLCGLRCAFVSDNSNSTPQLSTLLPLPFLFLVKAEDDEQVRAPCCYRLSTRSQIECTRRANDRRRMTRATSLRVCRGSRTCPVTPPHISPYFDHPHYTVVVNRRAATTAAWPSCAPNHARRHRVHRWKLIRRGQYPLPLKSTRLLLTRSATRTLPRTSSSARPCTRPSTGGARPTLPVTPLVSSSSPMSPPTRDQPPPARRCPPTFVAALLNSCRGL